MSRSTEILGTALVYGADDIWYQNIFVGGEEKNKVYGTVQYSGCPASLEEYIEKVCAMGNGDVELYEQIQQPAYISGNAYFKGLSQVTGNE